jgi:hypothetical protein
MPCHRLPGLGLERAGVQADIVVDAFAKLKLEVEWVICPAACQVEPLVSSAFSSSTVSAPQPSWAR